jgi:phospholipase/carboxylesterase
MTGVPDLSLTMREPVGQPQGALVLFHGRGTDEHDLAPLLEVIDPGRQLLGVTPRGPLRLPPGGAHWYAVARVGYPDPETFHATYERTSAWLGALGEQTGVAPERMVLGGFSQGAVMSYALGLGADRPRPAAIIALSSFIPTVPGWEPDLARPLPPVAIGHGTYDPVIPVGFGRQAKEFLEKAGGEVLFRESPLPHAIDPRFLETLRPWLEVKAGVPPSLDMT